jgi:hypothetical protein
MKATTDDPTDVKNQHRLHGGLHKFGARKNIPEYGEQINQKKAARILSFSFVCAFALQYVAFNHFRSELSEFLQKQTKETKMSYPISRHLPCAILLCFLRLLLFNSHLWLRIAALGFCGKIVPHTYGLDPFGNGAKMGSFSKLSFFDHHRFNS